MTKLALSSLIAIALCFCTPISGRAQITPTSGQISFTTIPAYGDTSTPLQGKISGFSSPTNYAIAPLIFVEGLGWYSKPTCAETTVPVQSDGTWSAAIVTGGVDQTAIRIAAFLVPAATIVACTTGTPGLPSISESVAHLVIDRPNPNARTIDFAGYKWQVKANSAGKIFPGPCLYSDSTNNVWVDGFGYLHLKVTTDGMGNWYCAEIYSERVFGYGKSEFTFGSQITNLDPNIVLGGYTWDDINATTANQEIDFEASLWGNKDNPNNCQFVIQPALPTPFQCSSDGTTQQSFTWRHGQVSFLSLDGNGQEVFQLPDTSEVPQQATAGIRMNLWIFNEVPPAAETEVIIRNFTFTPWEVDFDGDGILDYAVWRPSNGNWYVIPSSDPDSSITQQWGTNGDVPVTADYDGDGKLDYAVWRPSNGTWYVIPSGGGSNIKQQLGLSGDIPVVGDYDGDGIADFAVWRPSNGTWYIIPSSDTSQLISLHWGTQGDVPVPGDYDGDGVTDLAVWRPSNGTWYVMPSTDPLAPITKQWGLQGDEPVPGDYDGDGIADFAVWRPSNGTWYIIPSSNPSQSITQQWGNPGDVPVPRDYDNDLRTDLAVWRPSNGTWYVIPSSSPDYPRQQQWGLAGDVPAYSDCALPVQSPLCPALP